IANPYRLAGVEIQANDALDLLRRTLAVHDINSTAGNGHAAKAAAHRFPPLGTQFLRQRTRQVTYGPNLIALGTMPLRPLGIRLCRVHTGICSNGANER